MQTLVSDPDRWNTVGVSLSTARGDAQLLDEKTRSQVQREDRAIQTAERFNDRGHIVYCAVTLPHQVPGEAVNLPSTLHPGSRLDFDRHTMATHALYELDQTVRGAGCGVRDRDRPRHVSGPVGHDRRHGAPAARGMRFEVISAGEGQYRRPDGTIGRRMVVQLRDVTEE